MNLSLKGYLLGVAVAVGSFLIKELISYFSRGFLFRRQLTADMEILVSGFKNHLPELEKLKKEINASNPSASIIWDNDYTFLDHVYKYGHHLKSKEFQSCVCFYDTLGKIPEIRKLYNKAITEIITDNQHHSAHKKIAIACIKDLQKTYTKSISKGCEVLIEISKNHWFLNIKREYFKKLMSTFEE